MPRGPQVHPEYVSARVTLGRALLASNSLDDAFNELSGVLRTAPENLAALRGLGETHQRRGDQAAALTVFRRALALAPHDAELASLVSAIQPSEPAGNGDNRAWPPPSGSHPIAKPTQKTGPHPIAKVTPPTGRHPIVKPTGPIGLPVNEIEVRQPMNGDAHTAALDLLGAPPSDVEREYLGLADEPVEPSHDFDAAEARGATAQLEATPDLHDLLASQPMADDRITPDAREMLASWSVPPVEPPPVPVEPPPAPVDPLPADVPPSLPLMLEPAPAAPMLDSVASPEPELTLDPTATLESTLTPPLMLTAEETGVIVETPPVAAEPPTAIEEVSPSSIRLVARAPAYAEPELNPIEAAQVELLERWLESIKAAREQDHNPAQ